jgi:tRNA-2-methylthio-N6-dimethylallyladenosine synthase
LRIACEKRRPHTENFSASRFLVPYSKVLILTRCLFRDDVPEPVKKERLQEVINTFNTMVKKRNQAEIGQLHLALVEGESRRSETDLVGRSDSNKKVVFSNRAIPKLSQYVANPSAEQTAASLAQPKPGDYVVVKVTNTTGVTLQGTPIAISSLQEFEKLKSKVQNL